MGKSAAIVLAFALVSVGFIGVADAASHGGGHGGGGAHGGSHGGSGSVHGGLAPFHASGGFPGRAAGFRGGLNNCDNLTGYYSQVTSCANRPQVIPATPSPLPPG